MILDCALVRYAARVGLVCALLPVSNVGARAEIKDYMIARLITFKSTCGLLELKRHERSDGSVLFRATCSDEVFYPDGIDVICPDRDDSDDRACAIVTEKKKFQYLEMLRQ